MVITDEEVRAVAARDGDSELIERLESSLLRAKSVSNLPPRIGSVRRPDPDRPCRFVVIK